MKKLNVLVLSVSAISDEESNGRVLKSLLPDDELFCFNNIYSSGRPTIKNNIEYHCFNDKCAMRSLFSLGLVAKEAPQSNYEHLSETEHTPKNKKKTAFRYFIRNIIWDLSFTLKKQIMRTAINFRPDIVFLMGANFPIHYKLASKISKKTKAKLVIYNAEDYPLKKYDYMSKKPSQSLFSFFVQKHLFNVAKQTYSKSQLNFFNSEKLLDSYRESNFINSQNSMVIRLPSSLTRLESKVVEKTILFAGNLYDDRCETLINFANAAFSVDSSFKIIVFGKVGSEGYLDRFTNIGNIDYRGVVPFSLLQTHFQKTAFLLDVEGFSDYSKLDYKHSFSTKIADYLMLGKPLICCGDINIAGVEYLYKLNEDFTIVSKETMKSKLIKILSGNVKYSIDKNKISEEFSMLEIQRKMSQLFRRIVNVDKI